MTTNQTIDGVPRDRIERALDAIEQVGLQDNYVDYTFVRTVKQELRGLLDAPVPVAVDEMAEFTKWTHQVIAETQHQGVTIKVQRQHLSTSEHNAAFEAWKYRASLSLPPRMKG